MTQEKVLLNGVKGLVRIPAIGDGSCFFHSLLLAISDRYSRLDYKSKRALVVEVRRQISHDLDEAKYNSLSNGELGAVSEHLKGHIDLSIDGLRESLDSHDFVGQEFIELVSNEFDVDIYIVDLDKSTMYHLGDTSIYLKRRRSVIIGYSESNEHYDLVGLQTASGVATLFSPDHEVIQTLRGLLVA